MTSTTSRFFDEMAKMMTNAAGTAQNVRREIDNLVQAQVERIITHSNLVRREEMDVIREMAQRAREENDRLALRLAELEARLATPQSKD